MCHFAVATWPTMACMITLRFAALLACGTLLLGQPPKAAPSFSPELVKSGESLFLQQCAFCHGRDTGGGEDGPDLTRSKLVAEDVNGSQIGPVVRNGREKMPRFTVTDQELAALVAYIRTRKTIAESQKGGRKGVDAADLATGNIDKGKAYFNGVGKCNSCHSPTGDLAGTATRNNGLKLFQRLMYPAGVLDRTSGENLLTSTFGPVNWASGLDKKGQPIPNPAKEPAPDGRLVAPDEGGLTNYRSPSFDPKTGLFIVSAHPSYGIYFNKPADGAFGWAGADYGVWGKGVLEAIDYQTGKIKWTHELGPNGSGAGVLTTDAGLIFTGDGHGNMLVLRTSDGKTLWHAGLGQSMQSSPITYELDGRQYVLAGAGGVLFSWALPE
jgi:mono/diheme cytochrome c family protein